MSEAIPPIEELLHAVNGLRAEVANLKASVSANQLAGELEPEPESEPEPEPQSDDRDDLEGLAETIEMLKADLPKEAPLEQNVGVALTEEEIEALLSSTPGPTEGAVATEIVSADDIKVMLGLREPGEESDSETAVGLEFEPSEPEPEHGDYPMGVLTDRKPTLEVEVGTSTVVSDMSQVEADAVRLVPGQMAARLLVMPCRVLDGQLHCLSNDQNPEAIAEVSRASGLQCTFHLRDVSAVVKSIRRWYGPEDENALLRARNEEKPRLTLFRRVS